MLAELAADALLLRSGSVLIPYRAVGWHRIGSGRGHRDHVDALVLANIGEID